MSNTIITQPAVAGPTPPFGYFGTLDDVQDEGGKKNVVTYSNLDGRQNEADYPRLQRVMNKMDRYVTQYLRANGIGKPAVDSSGFEQLTDAWALLVLSRIYNSRGDLDTQNDSQGQTSADVWKREARRALRLYATQKRGGNITSSFAIG